MYASQCHAIPEHRVERVRAGFLLDVLEEVRRHHRGGCGVYQFGVGKHVKNELRAVRCLSSVVHGQRRQRRQGGQLVVAVGEGARQVVRSGGLSPERGHERPRKFLAAALVSRNETADKVLPVGLPGEGGERDGEKGEASEEDRLSSGRNTLFTDEPDTSSTEQRSRTGSSSSINNTEGARSESRRSSSGENGGCVVPIQHAPTQKQIYLAFLHRLQMPENYLINDYVQNFIWSITGEQSLGASSTSVSPQPKGRRKATKSSLGRFNYVGDKDIVERCIDCLDALKDYISDQESWKADFPDAMVARDCLERMLMGRIYHVAWKAVARPEGELTQSFLVLVISPPSFLSVAFLDCGPSFLFLTHPFPHSIELIFSFFSRR